MNRHSQSIRTLSWLAGLIVGITAGSTGCTGRNALKLPGVPFTRHAETRPIEKITAFWTPANGRDWNGSPSRGVEGQLMFTTPGRKRPIEIGGDYDIAVWMFDNQGAPEEQKKPIHKYLFKNNSLKHHLSVNKSLGPTYRIFIPYTRSVQHQVKCTLLVQLVPPEELKGKIPRMSSEMVTVSLPGPLKQSSQPAYTKMPTQNPGGEKTRVSTFNRQNTQQSLKPGESAKRKTAALNARRFPRGSFNRSQITAADFLPDNTAKTGISAPKRLSGIRKISTQSPTRTPDPRDEEIRRLKQMLQQQSLQQQTLNRRHPPERMLTGSRSDGPSPAGRSFRITPANNADPLRNQRGEDRRENTVARDRFAAARSPLPQQADAQQIEEPHHPLPQRSTNSQRIRNAERITNSLQTSNAGRGSRTASTRNSQTGRPLNGAEPAQTQIISGPRSFRLSLKPNVRQTAAEIFETPRVSPQMQQQQRQQPTWQRTPHPLGDHNSATTPTSEHPLARMIH